MCFDERAAQDDLRAAVANASADIFQERLLEAKRARHSDRYVSGVLDQHIEWDVDEAPDAVAARVNERSGNSDTFIELVRNLKEEIDPNDPRNLAMLEYQRRARALASRGKVFRHTQLPADLRLAVPGVGSDGKLGDAVSGRLKILKLRRDTDLLRNEHVPMFDADVRLVCAG